MESWTRPGPIRSLDALLFNGCAIVLGLGLGLELVSRLSMSPLLVRANNPVAEVIAKNRLAAGRVYFGSPVNGGGHHDREFVRREGETVLAAIGDSFSIGAVPHFFHYTTVAERILEGVQIFNLGVSGIGPPEYLHLLESEALALAPDIVLLSLFMGNDIAENGRFYRAGFSFHDAYVLQNVLLYQLPKRLLRARKANLESARKPLTSPGGDSLAFSSDAEQLESAFPWMRDPRLEESTLGAEVFMQAEKSRMWQVFRAGELALFDEFFPVLERIHEASGDRSLLVLMIPTEIALRARERGRVARG